MYKSSSKKSKSIFWIMLSILLILLIYSITLIQLATTFELIIAFLGWAYILLCILGWFDLLGEIFYLRKRWEVNLFSMVAIIGIIVAITLNIILNSARNLEALPITLIPAIIVTLYLIIGLLAINFSKKSKKYLFNEKRKGLK